MFSKGNQTGNEWHEVLRTCSLSTVSFLFANQQFLNSRWAYRVARRSYEINIGHDANNVVI